MQIKVNEKILKIDKCTTIKNLLKIIFQEEIGTAIAVNNIIIPRSQWLEYILKANDELVIFKVIAGG